MFMNTIVDLPSINGEHFAEHTVRTITLYGGLNVGYCLRHVLLDATDAIAH
jgi:hypothetical protein